MNRKKEGFFWIGISVLALIGTVDVMMDIHTTIPAALIGFSLGYILS